MGERLVARENTDVVGIMETGWNAENQRDTPIPGCIGGVGRGRAGSGVALYATGGVESSWHFWYSVKALQPPGKFPPQCQKRLTYQGLNGGYLPQVIQKLVDGVVVLGGDGILMVQEQLV